MSRREFILLIGAATTWSFAGSAQQNHRLIGFLSSSSPGETTRLGAFRRGIQEAGFIVGQDVAIEYRYAEGRYEDLPKLYKELVELRSSVILASALPAALAAKAANVAIPVVFVSGADPVQLGLVPSLNRPGGNMTGIANYFGALGGKRLELLRELTTRRGPVGYLLNPGNQNAQAHSAEVQEAARKMSQPLELLIARNSSEIESAFRQLVDRQGVAMLVGDDPYYNTERDRIVDLAARYAIPTIYYANNFVSGGGLISYGSDQDETYRLAGTYVGRILKGEKPSDLPVALPTKFLLAINLRTAKTLGLIIPPALLARADEVIE